MSGKNWLSKVSGAAFSRAWQTLQNGCRYNQELNATLYKAVKVSTVDEAKNMEGDVNIQYKSQEHYETLTERLGILREWKVCPFPHR